MLEGLVAWVLNNYLGKYVENLNTDQLSIALLSGEVELENLPLRKDALRHLGIPVEVRAGFIGKVRLQVPVRQLRSAPWVIVVERLYVVAGPARLDHADHSAELNAEHERKLSALDQLEVCWRENDARQNGPANYYQSSYSSWLNYGTGVITDIVENLQLRIKDVHIRYEDSSNGFNNALVCGLYIGSLSAQSCDEFWQAQFTNRHTSDGYSYKTVDLSSFAIYCDRVPHYQLLSNGNVTMADLASAMDGLGNEKTQHSYIVKPVSGYAHVRRNCSELPLRSSSTPRIVCDLQLNEVPIALANWQYERVISAARTLDFVSTVRKYRRWRPVVPVFEDARAWWLYAVRCIRPGAWGGRWTTPERVIELAKENAEYVRVYETTLAQPSAALTHKDKQIKEHVEWTRDLEQLRALREAAIRRVPPQVTEQKQPPTGGNVLAQWFPQWWGWYSTSGQNGATDAPSATARQLEGEILEVLADAVTDSTLLKRDAVFGRFSFSLNKGTLSLSNSENPMMELHFEQFELSVEIRPRSSSHRLDLALGSLCLRDLLTPGTLFPVLVGAPETRNKAGVNLGPLFKLECEVGPNIKKLKVCSQPLDVVYHAEAARYLFEFICGPYQRAATSLETVKAKTKERLIKNWENIVEGRELPTSNAIQWQLQLDISAPQIILAERLCDQNAAVAIVDLGRLHVTNQAQTPDAQINMSIEEDDEDDDMFVTPCSTPPGSEASGTTMQTAATDTGALNEGLLHERLYERYTAELSDIQVLACRARDAWRHAHSRGSSTVHVLEKFSIAARLERRLVRTADPMYPAVTLCASLPRLVAHVNEQKVAAARAVLAAVFPQKPRTLKVVERSVEQEEEPLSGSSDATETDAQHSQADALLLMLQLSVEHVSLQVQSRGRSVAELQVTGASAAFTRRPYDTAITLTVHGLLLVDALQTYGPDFELLVASHRHVGMDSISGSLRDSEPTSPTSPASPDPTTASRRATSPVALSRALSGLTAVSPPPFFPLQTEPQLAEALICVEYTAVDGPEPLRIANIQFNNLDVIANQETIVELMGFVRRIFPNTNDNSELPNYNSGEDKVAESKDVAVRTELTFDFHRLNVLLMRGDETAGGRKVATATMSGARIQATVDGRALGVHGSLGGLQLLDLTPDGRLHRRIISVGRDLLVEPPLACAMYRPSPESVATNNEALSIDLTRHVGNANERLEVQVRMASVWYTHSPCLLAELQSCAADFKQYLANVARTIKAAATDMALGLVQHQSMSTMPVGSPVRSRRRRSSISAQWNSCEDDEDLDTRDTPSIEVHLDVTLDSPVVVVPRSSGSTQVFVAHLGRISLDNFRETVHENEEDIVDQVYSIEIRDMNLYSLDTASRRFPSATVPRADQLYNCDTLAEPVLHDTIVQLRIIRLRSSGNTFRMSSDILLEQENEKDSQKEVSTERLEMDGSVINALRVSLTRAQYEQLLDTFRSLATDSVSSGNKHRRREVDSISEEHVGVGTLRMDPHVRAKLFRGAQRPVSLDSNVPFRQLKLNFKLPVFTVELRRTPHAVELSLEEFTFICEKSVPHETNIQVSLRSLHMDDLEQPSDGPLRHMAVSTAGNNRYPPLPTNAYVSHSCPDLAGNLLMRGGYIPSGSLPDHVCASKRPVYKRTSPLSKTTTAQRPLRTNNLVLVSCLLIDPQLISEDDFSRLYGSLQQCTQVDFNSLDMVVRPESWALVFDFFSGDDAPVTENINEEQSNQQVVDTSARRTELSVSVRSLTLTLMRTNGEHIARANISGVHVRRLHDSLEGSNDTEGRLGSMSLTDLTPHGRLYRERFQTLGQQALHVTHRSWRRTESHVNTPNALLRFEMATVLYVHTKRFVCELQTFFAAFGAERSANRREKRSHSTVEINRTLLEVQAGAPVILLPVSSSSDNLLVADLGRLMVSNTFITRTGRHIDVMSVELFDMDLYAAKRVLLKNGTESTAIRLGNDAFVQRSGRSFLDDKCRLILTVERDLCSATTVEIPASPSLSIQGDLSTLEAGLDFTQYRLIRGLLAHNIGEPVDDLAISTDYTSSAGSSRAEENEARSTLTLLHLGLQNVVVRLNEDGGKPLASIHFIRSRLTVENFSDGAQDIDLLSQEIVVVDTRPDTGNVFTDILGPSGGKNSSQGSGLEVHSRRRPDQAEFTVLLNNMRVMCIPEWWRMAREYILSPLLKSPGTQVEQQRQTREIEETREIPYELKINVTNSEMMVVQDIEHLDTSALTLRSTTVISYRPTGSDSESGEMKPLSCNLNHCELFSCVLGQEDDTALSIIDPVTVGVELSEKGILEVQLQQRLNIRLSYHDCLMLADMAQSFSKRKSILDADKNIKANKSDSIRRLVGLGFSTEDCIIALETCSDDLEEAALWLTQNALHDQRREQEAIEGRTGPLACNRAVLKASCLMLTVIDDCGDADVPLAELCLSDVTAEQPLIDTNEEEGLLECKLSCDYYNRALSGWEPCLEPWPCNITWQQGRRLIIGIRSESLLNFNVTTALIDLYRLVSENWRKDMAGTAPRRRRRFIPFALKNDTGTKLCFTTVVTSGDEDSTEVKRSPEKESDWKWVEPGQIIPFEFSDRKTGRRRHGDTHRPRIHSLRVRVLGWLQYAHVSVDRVGAYFRDVSGREDESTGPDRARVVFDVQLDGSARKLVTVRSALVIINKLPEIIDVRLGTTAEIQIDSNVELPVPLEYSHQQLHVRPSGGMYSFCQPEIEWRSAQQKKQESRECRAGPRIGSYHLSAEVRCELWPVETTPIPLPSHTITILPALLITNLLPHELHYAVRETVDGEPTNEMAAEGIVPAGEEKAVTSVRTEANELDLQFRLEGFRCCGGVRLANVASMTSGDIQCRVRLEDMSGRRLNLQAAVTWRGTAAGLRVAISAPYWILNRTGLPLVFRQEGVASDTAGQYEEHEGARMVAPLLFSWTDTDASPSVVCRIGTAAAGGTSGQPLWCQNFHLRRGVQVRRLRVTHDFLSTQDGRTSRSDTVYVIGIEVRPGRGRYRQTSIVTVSPRHQIHNRSAGTLLFSQQCYATTVNDPGARPFHVRSVPGCQIPFHWPRQDKDPLLCVRDIKNDIVSDESSLWSGGLRIDTPRSLHVSLRDRHSGVVRFLRLEVLARGAVLHAVFSDSADELPPPLRLDNRSEVTVTFSQKDVTHTCVAKANTQVPYAWDEPDARPSVLIVTAPGGATAECDMERLGPVAQLTYENFIYVAFTGTFGGGVEDQECGTGGKGDLSSSDVERQRLVLDVTEEGGRVSLATKQPGRRSQLWRMTSTGQLQHEGSPADRILVLDIDGPAPQPARGDSRLALRRSDQRRRSTQTWRFTAEGRLCCAHENMCVQPRNALWGLRSGGEAVLAAIRPLPQHRADTGTLIEQAVGKQRMRPGSGFLTVEVTTDGPTRVLEVRDDIAERLRHQDSTTVDTTNLSNEGKEVRLVIRLSEGFGISVVGKGPPQELLYAHLGNVVAELSCGTGDSRQLCLSVGDVQCDNQLFGTDAEVVIFVPRARTPSDAERNRQGPAISISAELQAPLIYRHLVVRVNPLAVTIEETLLLRLAEFLGMDRRNDTPTAPADSDQDMEDIYPGADGAGTRAASIMRYYFGVINLSLGPLRLSVRTAAGKLPARLRALRKRLGLTLIQFEDAAISLEPFSRRHSYDTWQSTWRSIYAHFREELVWQAATILGNVDFLGGPLGLVSDVTEGVSGLINDRSVGALFMNVTHGISNSAAKVTDALGDGLGRVFIMDDAHEETRQRIRRGAVVGTAPAAGGHLVAGIKGLGFGLLDGATGLFRHVYEGAAADGVQGALSGVGRGLVGIVAKPVVGVLDLAGETARAVRDSSRGSARQTPDRKRHPRVAAAGPGGLLPRYGNGRDARGQGYLHRINGGERTERFVAYGSLRCGGTDDLRLVVGSERVRVVTSTGDPRTPLTIVTEVRLEDVVDCTPVSEDDGARQYVELVVRVENTGPGSSTAARRPRIRCDTDKVARWAARQVNFARRMLAERRYTLNAPDGSDVTTPM